MNKVYRKIFMPWTHEMRQLRQSQVLSELCCRDCHLSARASWPVGKPVVISVDPSKVIYCLIERSKNGPLI